MVGNGMTLLETQPDRRRICILLRAAGWSFEDIAAFAGISVRLVRYELEQAVSQYPGLLDQGEQVARGSRMMRLMYLLGASDAGAPMDELPAYMEGLEQRAKWMRSRIIAREKMSDRLGRPRILGQPVAKQSRDW